MADQLLTHAREFTNIEVEGLTIWNAVQDLGTGAALQLAREILDAILMAEHYTSLLNNDPAQRSADQLTQLQLLRSIMDEKLQAGRQLLRAGDKTPSAN